jgi:hypothetical protein
MRVFHVEQKPEFFGSSRKNRCSKMARKGCFSEREGDMCGSGGRAVLGSFAAIYKGVGF